MQIRRRVAALTLAGCAAMAAGHASAASADVTQSDSVVKVTLVGGVTDQDDNFDSGARTPTFRIQVLIPDTTVQCHMNFNVDGSCGTQQTTGCPAIQCWTYTPSVANGTNFIYVDYTPAKGVPSEFDFDFTTYDLPPHTALQTPPDPNDNYAGLQSVERPVFTVGAPGDLLPVSFQCSLSTSASRPGSWGSCRLPRLKLLGVYHFSERAVDVLGRVDPAPPQYTFSPTPCRARVRGRPPTFAGFLRHGLAISVTCIQPGGFESDLDLPLSLVERYHLPAQTVGYVKGRTTRPQQTLRLTVHALRGVPTFLTHLGALRLEQVTGPIDAYGASHTDNFKARP